MKTIRLIVIVVTGILMTSMTAAGQRNEKRQFRFSPALWSLDYQIVNELAVREPSMCEGRATKWNRCAETANKLPGCLPDRPASTG